LTDYFGESNEIIYENSDGDKVNRFLNFLAELYHNHKDGFNLMHFIDDEVTGDVYATNSFLENGDVVQVRDMLYDIIEEYHEEYPEDFYAGYSYTDDRQQELFSDEDFKLSEEEQKEAEEYKKACEGGKV
jgi:hypothetical protein